MKAFFNGLFALVILAAAFVALAFGVRWGLAWLFDGVNPTVSAAIVAAMATTIVSVLGVTLGRYLERGRQIEIEIRERKIPMYQKMVGGLLNGIQNAADDGTSEELLTLFKTLTPDLVTWASDDVIKAWNGFKRKSSEVEPIALMFEFEKVLEAVRKDLGHKGGSLSRGDLLGLFINDIHEHLDSTA